MPFTYNFILNGQLTPPFHNYQAMLHFLSENFIHGFIVQNEPDIHFSYSRTENIVRYQWTDGEDRMYNLSSFEGAIENSRFRRQGEVELMGFLNSENKNITFIPYDSHV